MKNITLLRNLLFDRGISQSEVAEKLGISQGTFSLFMNGWSRPKKHKKILIEYFNLDEGAYNKKIIKFNKESKDV